MGRNKMEKWKDQRKEGKGVRRRIGRGGGMGSDGKK